MAGIMGGGAPAPARPAGGGMMGPTPAGPANPRPQGAPMGGMGGRPATLGAPNRPTLGGPPAMPHPASQVAPAQPIRPRFGVM
jgi:hypothetical protein